MFRGVKMIKPEVLVAWLETEGWMRVRINPKNNYIDAEIGISQKEIWNNL